MVTESDPYRDHGAPTARGGQSPWLVTAVVALAVLMEVLDITIVGVALPQIAGNLGASVEQSTWVLTSYLVANAIMLPLSGWLATAIGRKRFYLLCLASFTLSSLACGLSGSLTALIVFRTAQGLSGAGMVPMANAILADSFPPEKRGQAFALFAMVVVVGPALGPPFGGWLTDVMSWHWIFLVNIPGGILAITLTALIIRDPPWIVENRERWLARGMHIDIPGLLLTATGLGSLVLFLEEGQRNDWFASTFITSTATISALALIALVFWEWRHRQPIVNLRLFTDRGFAAGCTLFALFGALAVSSAQLLPQFAQQLLGYSATDAGLALMFGALITLVLMPIAGQMTERVQPKYMVTVGLCVQVWAYYTLYGGFNAQLSFWELALARMGQIAGFPFVIVPVLTAAFVRIPGEQNNQASAIINMCRAVGGSAGVALFQATLEQRGQFHQSRIVETLTATDAPFQQALDHIQGAWVQLGAGPEGAMTQAYATVYQLVRAQAQALAYIDVFTLTAGLVALTIPVAFLLPRVSRS